MIARINYVENFLEDAVHPLLPNVPVSLIEWVCITIHHLGDHLGLESHLLGQGRCTRLGSELAAC